MKDRMHPGLQIVASFAIAVIIFLAIIGVVAIGDNLARSNAATVRHRAEAICQRQGGRVVALASGDWWCDIPRPPRGPAEQPRP